jgi:very-short-patch-repair endonuclease/predicted transcriptional regulator of viral defense system
MRTKSAGDEMLAALAAEQYGVVARSQLLAAGVSASTVKRWTAARRLLPLHRGVYAVGHDCLTRDGHWLAAVLAAGPGAVLSHREAAAVHGLRPSDRPTVDVSVAARRRVVGVQVHRVERLDAADVAVVAGIPTTALARTLVDLADVVPPRALCKAFEEAERSHRLDVRAVEAVLRRTRGRNSGGRERVRDVLTDLASTGTIVTRSTLEDRFLTLLDAHDLPRPLTNQNIAGMEVDAHWPAARVVAELDGWDPHRTRHAFQRDRERSAELTANGYAVLRFTHDHIVRRPAWVATRLRRLLAQAAAGTG